MLRNAMGSGCSDFGSGYFSVTVTKVYYGPMLLALRGRIGVKFPQKKHHVILEWHLLSGSNG